MIQISIGRLFLVCLFCTLFNDDLKSQEDNSNNVHPKSDLWLNYSGSDGPGKGKHVVLIAAEQEYRSEQSMPMLAKVLSNHHGFDCTVLFSVNEKGEVDPTVPAPFKDK
ncbi:MAG: hypothetical protein VX016_05100 [Verrucomicrobiota bacterium]|nr:hypothetical protein [Verrucomicrobiota bacterium]